MKNTICIIILGLFFQPAFAQKINLVERVIEMTSTEKNQVTARQTMVNQATEKVSQDLIKEMIGEAKYNRNKSVITAKIVNKSARYIPFSKPGEMKETPSGFSMSVVMKVNPDDLQSLLLENGLLYESDGTPAVLPMVKFTDKVNSKSYSWWAEGESPNKTFLVKEGKYFEEKLKDAFSKVNFYALKPLTRHYFDMLPSSYQSESLRPEDVQRLSQVFSSPILLEGHIQFLKSPTRSEAQMIEIKLTASQSSNGRVIAEVSRQFETDMGAFEVVIDRKMKEVLEGTTQDLANQVLEAWQRGALGSSLYKLTIRGRISLKEQEAFKTALKNKVREVKNIRERLITSDGLTYEVDASIGPQELGKKAPTIEMQGYKLVLESATESGANYKVAK